MKRGDKNESCKGNRKRENQSLALRAFARYYGSYQVPLAIEKRFGAEATIARRFKTYKNLSGSIGFGVESVSLSDGDAAAVKRRYAKHNIAWSNRQKELDDGFYVKLTPALTAYFKTYRERTA